MTSVQVCAIVQVQNMKAVLGGNEAGRLLKFLAPSTNQRQASCEQITRDLLLIILLHVLSQRQSQAARSLYKRRLPNLAGSRRGRSKRPVDANVVFFGLPLLPLLPVNLLDKPLEESLWPFHF